jgi:hypothetical protein
VFLALGIGVLLGVSIGEEGIVSGAREDLERSLRGDLRDVRSRNSELRAELRLREDYERQVYPALVADLLPGFRVGVVAMGDLPSRYTEAVRDAVEPAGADIESISVVRAPIPLEDVAEELRGTSFARLDRERDALDRFGRRLGSQLVEGGGLAERVGGKLLSSSRGDYRGLDAVVWVRDREGLKGDDRATADRFEAALIEGLRATDAPVVGIETRDADPSQIPFMRVHGLTSVDDVDLVAGRTALVYALLRADGQFGVKDTASQLLPPPPLEERR